MFHTYQYHNWFIHCTDGQPTKVQSPTGEVIALTGILTDLAAKQKIAALIKTGDYCQITKSERVKCPEFKFTDCGKRSKIAVLKSGLLPTGSGNDYKLTARELRRVERLSHTVLECDLSTLPAVKLTTDSGYTWSTSVSHEASAESLTDYFVGQQFETAAYPKEQRQLCVKIEFIN